MNQPVFIASLGEILPLYDAFVLDLWGVIHDGRNPYPGARDALYALRAAGKRVVLLSNAPRRASIAEEALRGMDIGADAYDAIVTSGEVAYQCLAHPEQSPFKPRGHNYIYIGLERDRCILEGLHYEEVKHPEHAQFVLLSHSYEDNQPFATLKPLLEGCVKQGLPVVCINPDKEVVRITGERVYCAGALADEYHMMGGEVVYFGKPHRAVYERVLDLLEGIDRSRIVAVGDTLGTDILGGNKTHLSTVLVAGGVLRAALGDSKAEDFKKNCETLFKKEQIVPNYVIAALS